MGDEKSRMITLRLTEASYQARCREAAEQRLTLSVYLRQLLEGDLQALRTDLHALRGAVEELLQRPDAQAEPARSEAPPPPPAAASSPEALGIAAETLLLLRAATNNPQVLKLVHKELERRGLPVWK